MIDLNKEAEEVLCYLFPDNETMTRKQYNNALKAIKSITNSKYVKQQILNFCIKELDYIKTQCYNTRQFKSELLLKNRIELLQQKLKQLEDE